jgi:membrane protein required for colicin V production
MTMAHWNWFDWMLFTILGVSALMGFRRGLVRTLFGLAGFVGGLLLATWDYTKIGKWINGIGMIESTSTARIVAFLGILAFVVVIAELVAGSLTKTIQAAGFSLIDRTLGAGFGLVRGCMIGIAVLIIPTTFAPRSKLIATSVISPYLFEAAHDVSFLVPQSVEQRMIVGRLHFKKDPTQWINRN